MCQCCYCLLIASNVLSPLKWIQRIETNSHSHIHQMHDNFDQQTEKKIEKKTTWNLSTENTWEIKSDDESGDERGDDDGKEKILSSHSHDNSFFTRMQLALTLLHAFRSAFRVCINVLSISKKIVEIRLDVWLNTFCFVVVSIARAHKNLPN